MYCEYAHSHIHCDTLTYTQTCVHYDAHLRTYLYLITSKPLLKAQSSQKNYANKDYLTPYENKCKI